MPYSNMTFTVTTGLAFVVNDFVLISAVDAPATTTTTTTTVAPTTTTTSTTTTAGPVYYNILDCGNSSTAYSIVYAPGTFATSERCTAVASGFPTRTVIIIGSTTTLPGGPLYTLTSQGTFGCP